MVGQAGHLSITEKTADIGYREPDRTRGHKGLGGQVMKIDLTRKEYRDLLDMLSIAEWVLNAHKVEKDPRTERYRKPEQKFFALAKRMKYENLIAYAPEHDRYFPTREYEEKSSTQAFITEYDNDSFWEE
jgi:hypothetical protein